MKTDVLVIGGGLSGATAALAAKTAGAKVCLVWRSLGRTALCNGLLTLAKAAPTAVSNPLDLSTAIRQTRALDAFHPFSIESDPLPTLMTALAAWQSPLAELYDLARPLLQESPKAFVHEFGALCYAQAAPRSHLAIRSDGPRRIGVVELASFSPLSAEMVAGNLNAALADFDKPPVFSALHVPFSPRARYQLPAQLAAALDNPAVLDELLSSLKDALLGNSLDALLFAPILGLRTPNLAERISQALGLPVFEAAAAQNSVPGLRLQNALFAALRANGVEVVHGALSRLVRDESGAFLASFALDEQSAAPLEAARVVLATGKFLAGGLVVKGRSWREALADCPLFLGGDPIRERFIGHLSQADFFASQAMAYVGLRTDAGGLVLDEQGAPYKPGLFACGHLLGGFDAFAGVDNIGVDLLSGWRAGCSAAGEVLL